MVGKTGYMTINYTNDFLRQLKKLKVIIRKSFKIAIEEFSKNPNSPQLNNHRLKRKWVGFRSINITADWRAIYKESVNTYGELIIYFVAIGTHERLYKSA